MVIHPALTDLALLDCVSHPYEDTIACTMEATKCAECHRLFSSPPKHSLEYRFQKTVADLEESSRLGCEICHLQFCLLSQEQRDEMLE
jgi:hypothetical protein